jgi:hypothetical protein
MKSRDDVRAGAKKRQAVPNPNKKFISIHKILGKGGNIKDLEEDPVRQENSVVEEEEDIYGVSDEDIVEDIPAEVITRSGNNIRKPAKYAD